MHSLIYRTVNASSCFLRFCSFFLSILLKIKQSSLNCQLKHSSLVSCFLFFFSLSFCLFHFQLFAAVDVLVAIITSAKNDSSANGSHAASFASVWTLFMVVAVSVTGTVILKKVRHILYLIPFYYYY